MTHRLLAGAAGMLVLGGCSSVDQVPLVYVSTTKVGLNVESGSAETPGASIMIGVDLTDAAYVPVAVARKCDGISIEMMKVCADRLLAILPIIGISNAFSENDKARILALTNETEQLRRNLLEADSAYAAALISEENEKVLLERAKAAKTTADRLGAAKANREDQSLAFPQEQELQQALSASAQLTELDTRYRQAMASRVQAREELDAKRDDLKSLMDKFKAMVPDKSGKGLDQQDALSVFGTFTGRMGAGAGEKTSANVNLGKTFSTGVAAQNMASGVADGTRLAAQGRVECLAAIGNTFSQLPEGERTVATLNELLAHCSA